MHLDYQYKSRLQMFHFYFHFHHIFRTWKCSCIHPLICAFQYLSTEFCQVFICLHGVDFANYTITLTYQ